MLLIIVTVVTTGCWDRRELEERISVLAIGIDHIKGKEDRYRISVQIPIPIKIAGSGGRGGGSSGDAVKIVTTTGKTVQDAMNNLQKRLNQQIFVGHTRVLAISEDVARAGMKAAFDAYRRDPTIRRLLWPVIVKGEARTLLMANPKLSQIPVVFIMDLIENGARSGMIPDQTLGDFYSQTSNQALQPIMNYVEATEEDVGWRGVAVFRNHKMVGTLEDEQTWVLLQLRDQMQGGDVVVPLPGNEGDYLTFRPHFVDTHLEMKHTGGSHHAHYTCTVQGDVIENTKGPQIKGEQGVNKLQEIIKREMEKRAAELLVKLQKEYRSDVLKLGLWVKGHHQDYWSRHDWETSFPDLPIKVTYDIRIRRFGMEMQ
ncbi:Ger(x)C family spore germination protein [Brevibacillus humidisoli]|uniref:Ger(x)C family spore germination protein n=1 Tax=Brevibacillus humidisoli TaxID=2895522 RepID=UPI001E64AECA|nr:Ger(x)C family spore germination protein [Brevibacillus humidisoli]UFJ39189.1 Ger(x)C family spore germination protein [Brevibacillus humidisoli]